MAKKIFFSFHYQDVIDFRANVVRNSWMTRSDHEEAGFFDHSLWESTKRYGEQSLKTLINNGLQGSSVTAVLIGTNTFERPWVRYEIFKSIERGNKLIGIHINSIKCKNQGIKYQGHNPFDYTGVRYNHDGSFITALEYTDNNWINSRLFKGSLGTNNKPSLWNSGKRLSDFYPTYDWIADDGYQNLGKWVE